MSQGELYKKYAKYYDKIYAKKDYKLEAGFIQWLAEEFKTNPGNSILDVACGTGNHAFHLVKHFDITGIDINNEMLKLAKKKVKAGKFIKGDMKTLNLGTKFDVLMCMFSTIAYNLTYNELESTLRLFYDHLNTGGILIFDLNMHEDYWLGDRVWINTVVESDLQLARISPSPEKKPILDLDLIFFVKEKGKIDFDIDQHQIGLFNVNKINQILSGIGFDTKIFAGFENKQWTNKLESPALFMGVKK
jgi:SAM-dependent methyltransferase